MTDKSKDSRTSGIIRVVIGLAVGALLVIPRAIKEERTASILNDCEVIHLSSWCKGHPGVVGDDSDEALQPWVRIWDGKYVSLAGGETKVIREAKTTRQQHE